MDFNIDLGKVGITVKGPWSSDVSYEKLTIVTHNGSAYVSLRDNQGVEPTPSGSTAWSHLVSSGSGGGGGSDSGGGSGSGGGGGDTIVQGDTMTVAYYSDGKLYWKKNGNWMLDPDGNKVPVGAAASEVITSDNDIELKYSSITSPGNPSDNPSYWVNAGNANTIWMAIRLKRNGVWGSWSILQVRGKDGQDGQDGADATSIGFKGTFTDPDQLPANPTTGDAYLFKGDTFTDTHGKVWTNGHLFVWDGDSWEDLGQITGPPGENNYIHVAFSNDGGVTLTGSNGTLPGKYFGTCVTNSATRPLTASSYTWVKAQGEDGFGYEFIYKLTTTQTAPAVPASEDVDEYVPSGWTDDQDDVTETYKYCWQCYRMKKNGHWGNYIGSISNNGYATLVARWGRDGSDGQDGTTPNTSFKSIVFKRSSTTPDTPTGGSYASPVPSGWSDGIPSGDGKIWMSTRIFSSDGQSPQQGAWTEPNEATDTRFMDYEWAVVDNPGTPNKANPNANETNPYWYDEPGNVPDPTQIQWMAMRPISSGEYESGSSWLVMHVKGETGQDGTGISIKGTKDSVAELPDVGNTEGDAWLVNGDLYVWDGDSWENAGHIQGEPGDDGQTPYIHIKYGNKSGNNIVFTANNGETPGDYIGLYWDFNVADSSNVNDYTWKYWKGEDGFGYEYIFKATEMNDAPVVPNVTSDPNFQNDDFVPTGWHDDSVDLSPTNRYRWKCWRKKTDGVWGAFQGSSSNPGYAIFDGNYAQNGATGIGISEVTEYYQISNDGVNPPQTWSVQVMSPTEQKKFLWNYEVIHYTNNNQVATPPCVIGVYGTGKGIESVVEMYLATTLSSGITRNTQGWTTSVQMISRTKPFLWNYEIINFTDGTQSMTDPVVIGHFGVDGGQGDTGVGISQIIEYYGANDDVTQFRGTWSTTVPQLSSSNKYLWNYERIVYTNNNHVDTPPCIIGVFGEDGAAGRGISQVEEYYLVSASANEVNDVDEGGQSERGWMWESPGEDISEAKPYLWNFERIWFTDGTYYDTYPCIIGIYTISALSTYAYLKAIFGEDNVSGQHGAILRNLLGVLDDNENCVAMINASVIGKDVTHGKLMIAAGMTNVSAPNTAKFKVYEDGHVEMIDCKVKGEVEATSIKIADDAGNTKLRISGQDFQVGSVERQVSLNQLVLSNLTPSTSNDIVEFCLGTITVPAGGATRLFVPGIKLSFAPLNSTSNMRNSKVGYRIFLTRTNGSPVMIDGESVSDIEDEIEYGFNDWLYVGGSNVPNSNETTPQYVLAQSLQAGEVFSVYIHYYFDYAPGDSGTGRFTCNASDPMSLTTQPAVQGFSIGNNGFQMSLGDGFFISAVNNNGSKSIFLSSRCDDGTDAWIRLNSDGIYIRNKGDNTERKL